MKEKLIAITTAAKRFIGERFLSFRVIKRLLVAAILFWIPMIIFLEIADEIREGEPIRGDTAVLQWLNSLSSPALDTFMIAATNTSGPIQAVVIAAIIIVILLLNKKRRAATFMLFALGGAAIINVLLKLLFARNRPDLWETVVTERSYSFPSGHAMGSSALAFSLMVLLWPTKWRWWAIVIGSLYIILIGTTRLYLGVHYPSDVIAGWAVSLAWVLTIKTVLDNYKLIARFQPGSGKH